MLQEAAHHRFHADVLGEAGHAWAQAADAAHDQIDLHPRRARPVELLDDRGVRQRVHLGPDRPRPAGANMVDLAVDHRRELLAKTVRRDGDPLEIVWLDVAGDVVEHLARITRHPWIGGEEA